MAAKRSDAGKWSWCSPDQKRAYFSRGSAKAAIRILPARAGMREYRCGVIEGGWHIGHLPGGVRKGFKTLNEFFPRRNDDND